MFKKKFHILQLCLLLTQTTSVHTAIKVIIWDLGHVLAEPSGFGWAMNLGLVDLCCYTMIDHKNPMIELRRLMFEVIQATRAHQSSSIFIPDDQGKALPPLFCDYQAGLITSAQARQELKNTMKRLTREDFFSNRRERKLVMRALMSAFTPEIFARSMTPIKRLWRLVEELSYVTDEFNNPYYEQIILSNWDRESFEIFKQDYEKLFKFFKPENIFISGNYKHYDGLKPNSIRILFDYLKKIRHINPNECLVIDDQKINGITTQMLGGYSFTGSVREIEEQIRESGLLQPQTYYDTSFFKESFNATEQAAQEASQSPCSLCRVQY